MYDPEYCDEPHQEGPAFLGLFKYHITTMMSLWRIFVVFIQGEATSHVLVIT